jgi:hypothetical protein
MANIFSVVVVTFALLVAATGIGLWAAAPAPDRATASYLELRLGSQLELPR